MENSSFNENIEPINPKDIINAKIFNERFQMLLDNDKCLKENGSSNSLPNSRQDCNMIDLAIEIEKLKNSSLNGASANMVVESFISLDDITLTNGLYDGAGKKIYLL